MRKLLSSFSVFVRHTATVPNFQQRRAFSPISELDKSSNFIPELTLLENIKRMVIERNLLPDVSNIVVVGVQHIVESTGSLLKAMLDMRVSPEDMVLVGKCYSTNPKVAAAIQDMGITLIPGTTPARLGKYQQTHLADIHKMWELCLKKLKKTRQVGGIIILDDGYQAIKAAPSFNFPIIGIIQTRAGMYSNIHNQVPVINVAQSDTKQRLESWLIQKKIVTQLKDHLREIDKYNHVIGIVGCGSIGLTLARALANDGYSRILIYDENLAAYPPNLPANIIIASSLKQLFFESRFVFGCTGKDITANIDLLKINNQDGTYASCSSADNEFKRVLEEIDEIYKDTPINPLQDIELTTFEKRKIRILNGGFPINFDRQSTSVPNHQIALTRGLLFSAFVQGASLIANYSQHDIKKTGNIMLSPYLQKFVLDEWRKTLDPELQVSLPFRQVESIELIKGNSAGIDLSCEFMDKFWPSSPTQNLSYPLNFK